MAFSYQQQHFTPEELNPNIFQKALQNYNASMEMKYKPQQMQADIFNKEISPLAALASSPNFTGFNPQIQRMIAERIGGYLGGKPGQSGQMPQQEANTPGYASGEDIYKRLSKGATASFGKGAIPEVAKSTAAGYAEQLGLPDFISHLLGGSKRVGKTAEFNQALEEGVAQLMRKNYTEKAARESLAPRKGESDVDYNKRIQKLFVESPSHIKKNASEQKSNNQYKDMMNQVPSSIPKGMIDQEGNNLDDVFETAKHFNATPNEVIAARDMGIKKASEFKAFLKEHRG